MGYESKPLQKLLHADSQHLYIVVAMVSLVLLASMILSLSDTNSLPAVRLKIAWNGNYKADNIEKPSETRIFDESEKPPCKVESGLCEKDEHPGRDAPVTSIDVPATTVNASSPHKSDARRGGNGNASELVLTKHSSTPICNTSYTRTVVCEIPHGVRIHGNSGTIHFPNAVETITTRWPVKPYARKEDPTGMAYVRELTVTQLQASPLHCQINHTIPALVFSTGGYLGNVFHDFVDVLVPLFITSVPFSGEVQFLITNYNPWWISKYKPILDRLTRHDLIDLDKDDHIRCFPRATVGLKRHDTREFSINHTAHQGGLSLKDFSRLLRSAFSLERSTASIAGRPRLLIISRKWTRKFVNLDEITKLAESVGFEVVVSEGGEAGEFAGVVNSCDAMMGVHGAGLTNEVFLPEGAVVVQVVPLGGMLWWNRGCFGEPAVEMGLRYLDYEIEVEESTLAELYPRNHTVLRDPGEVGRRGGWTGFGKVYLEEQSVRLNVTRFRSVLSKAMELLRP